MEADQNFLINNLIVNNLQNYLREIGNPSKENKIRWPLELIQNAKDSLYLTPSEQKQVSITLEIKGNPDNVTEVIFWHDGPPFTKESYYGLMYKFSFGKKTKIKLQENLERGLLRLMFYLKLFLYLEILLKKITILQVLQLQCTVKEKQMKKF